MGSISLKTKSKSNNLTAPGDVDLGAMIPIATSTVGAGGVATVTFSSIPANYEHLQLRYITRNNRSGQSVDAINIKANGDINGNDISLNNIFLQISLIFVFNFFFKIRMIGDRL